MILPRQAPPIERKTRPYCGSPLRATVGLCNDAAVPIVAAVYLGLPTLRPRDLVQGPCPYVSRKTTIGDVNEKSEK